MGKEILKKQNEELKMKRRRKEKKIGERRR